MNNKWIERFLHLAELVSSWSKDPRTKVGAVIVAKDKSIVSLGYNGFPSSMEDKPEWYEDREFKHRYVIHAEHNALLNALKCRSSVSEDCTLFVNYPPCLHCLSMVAQSGIKTIYYELPHGYNSDKASLVDIEEHAKRLGLEIVNVPTK